MSTELLIIFIVVIAGFAHASRNRRLEPGGIRNYYRDAVKRALEAGVKPNELLDILKAEVRSADEGATAKGSPTPGEYHPE